MGTLGGCSLGCGLYSACSQAGWMWVHLVGAVWGVAYILLVLRQGGCGYTWWVQFGVWLIFCLFSGRVDVGTLGGAVWGVANILLVLRQGRCGYTWWVQFGVWLIFCLFSGRVDVGTLGGAVWGVANILL